MCLNALKPSNPTVKPGNSLNLKSLVSKVFILSEGVSVVCSSCKDSRNFKQGRFLFSVVTYGIQVNEYYYYTLCSSLARNRLSSCSIVTTQSVIPTISCYLSQNFMRRYQPIRSLQGFVINIELFRLQSRLSPKRQKNRARQETLQKLLFQFQVISIFI